ncbi:sugar phosphate isomerase/epimerase family protein [Novosphingobium album (ex Liu et al. 2023)]|uniref:TIM barrel protein n=1 Tax=Novosphingobium album (ex Liu et al. 2023) TaxID=3031130 RepID=A0ABT5WXA9_9SPHN|nr:TIM barrel protein [Novosphingobium album (ex Liu et al. 2023)]MDE8654535.1 TIM barrel protein [Novosphingobium album (ex Liu et al. 2023)]
MKLGIENISVFGLPPVAFVDLAADLGCQHISTGLSSFPFGVHDYPAFSLRDDAVLRREMIAAMADRGVSISLGEGCTIRDGAVADDYARDLDVFAELGAQRINTVSMDPDLGRTCAQFARLAELATERGLRITTEFAPSLTIADLPTALSVLRAIGRPDFRLLIDTMHLVRSGGGPEDIAALDPELIDYVQVCDAPRVPRFESYFEESMFERMVPGEGELGLSAVLAALPADRVFSLEVPLRSEGLAGMGPRERLGKCVEALRALLIEAHGQPA